MNRQRKVLVTVTYNELGVIVDTKTEELDSSAQPERTETHSCDYQRTETHDLVSRREAIKTAKNVAYYVDEHGSANGWLAMLVNWLEILPSAQPEPYAERRHDKNDKRRA